MKVILGPEGFLGDVLGTMQVNPENGLEIVLCGCVIICDTYNVADLYTVHYGTNLTNRN